jgi:hypothetical protein
MYSSLVESLSLALVRDCGIVEECMEKCVEMHSYGRESDHSENINIDR